MANYHPKNLNEKDFDFSNLSFSQYFKLKNTKSLIYLNFQKSTNFKEREGLYELFLNQDWAKLELPKNDKKIYLENLKYVNFILTPHGNGRDTHRLWESLYSGSIPVVKEHIAYSYAKGLPVVFVKDYKEVTQELLINYLNESNEDDFNLQKLDFNYWRSEIKGREPDKSKTVILKTNSFRFFIFDLNYFILKNNQDFTATSVSEKNNPKDMIKLYRQKTKVSKTNNNQCFKVLKSGLIKE